MDNIKANHIDIHESVEIGDNVQINCDSIKIGEFGKIGNNVKIGGGSGVIKDIADNQIVMGYPAVSFKKFLKDNKDNE